MSSSNLNFSQLSKRLAYYRRIFQHESFPKISFPIATYNRNEILLTRTIPSILSQSYKNIEIVIVGDSMSDENFDQIRGLNDKRVKAYNLSRRTKYPQNPFDAWCVIGWRPRNIAARLASGSWVWWISDDDSISENAITNVVDYISCNHLIESIYGDRLFIDSHLNTTVQTLKTHPAPLSFSMTGIPAWINRNYISRLFPWNKLSYKNSYNKPSDYDMQERMKAFDINFGYLNSVLSISYEDPPYDLQGSKLYLKHPELLK